MSIVVHGHLTRGEFSLNLDVDLPTGLTVITGSNGSGKTTFLRLIAGLAALDSGDLLLNGSLVDREGQARFFVPPTHRDVALVFQDHRLFPHLTVLDNVAFVHRTAGRSRRVARDLASAELARFGLTPLANQRPKALSGGQRQRTAFARSVARAPAVLLLDEPLASIDPEGQTVIRRLIVEGELATTVLWVTHDPADAEGASSRLSFAAGHGRHSYPG